MTATNNRFEIEERSGIIGVVDTEHKDYLNSDGFHGEYNFVVASWTGFYNKENGYWSIYEWQREKAVQLCDTLNNLTYKKLVEEAWAYEFPVAGGTYKTILCFDQPIKPVCLNKRKLFSLQ